jgi:uridine kinase
MDAYYRDGGLRNFDVPDALDGDLLADHLSSLAEGNSVHRPVYDFVNHRRMECTELVEAVPWIFVEGIFALYWPEIRALYDRSIFVWADKNVCRQRRLDRDIPERGRSAASVRHQFETTVAPMADRYVYPTADNADWIVSGEESMDGLARNTIEKLRAYFD